MKHLSNLYVNYLGLNKVLLIKINFYFFKNGATKKLKMTYVPHIIFLLNTTSFIHHL